MVGNSINQGHIPHLNYTSLQRRGRPKGKDTHEIRMKSMKPVKQIIHVARKHTHTHTLTHTHTHTHTHSHTLTHIHTHTLTFYKLK